MTVVVAVAAWRCLGQRTTVGLVLTYGFLGFGVFSALAYRPDAADFAGPNWQVAYLASGTPGYQYLLIFGVAAAAVGLGSWIVSHRTVTRGRVTAASTQLRTGLLALAVVPLGIDIWGTGWSYVLTAPAYLAHTGPAAGLSIGRAGGMAATILCGYCAFGRREGVFKRISAVLIALCYEALFLGAATRAFALWPVLLFLGAHLTGSLGTKGRWIIGAVATGTAVLFLEIPLGLRGLPRHGLVSAVQYLTGSPSLVFGGHNPIHNVLFGAPLTYWVAHAAPKMPNADLAVALSPLPSRYTNWGILAPTLRVNIYTPYSASGELLNHGWAVFVAVFAAFGAAFVLIERLSRRVTGTLGSVGYLLTLGLGALFVVEATEYNLRSVTRLCYYAAAGVVVLTVIIPLLQRVLGPPLHLRPRGSVCVGAGASSARVRSDLL